MASFQASLTITGVAASLIGGRLPRRWFDIPGSVRLNQEKVDLRSNRGVGEDGLGDGGCYSSGSDVPDIFVHSKGLKGRRQPNRACEQAGIFIETDGYLDEEKRTGVRLFVGRRSHTIF